jgi:hypothetical protein
VETARLKQSLEAGDEVLPGRVVTARERQA